jgi:glucokinase
MVFLTCGTGMGAGLILDGKLYTGAGNLAGEAGHIRLAEDGPPGYGKRGSFEGFCSGGGIARLGRAEAERALDEGRPPLFCPRREDLEGISARSIAGALEQGDPLALSIYRAAARRLGQGIALIIDLLNPELVVLGSIYVRQQKVLEGPMREEIAREALSPSAALCRILPAGLGERVGDYAALSVGANALKEG